MLTRLKEQDAQLIERDEAIRRYRIRNEQLTQEIAELLSKLVFSQLNQAAT